MILSFKTCQSYPESNRSTHFTGGGSRDSVHLWYVHAGSLVDTIEAGKLVCSLHFGCKPDQLIVGLDNKDGNLGRPHLWDTENHTRLFDGGLASVAGIAVSPDCKCLVGCAHRYTFMVWPDSSSTFTGDDIVR